MAPWQRGPAREVGRPQSGDAAASGTGGHTEAQKLNSSHFGSITFLIAPSSGGAQMASLGRGRLQPTARPSPQSRR